MALDEARGDDSAKRSAPRDHARRLADMGAEIVEQGNLVLERVFDGPAGGAVRRRRQCRNDGEGQKPSHQMLERDWPPSTGMQAPLSRLACCEHANATTLATSGTEPKRPRGISPRTKSAMPPGSCRRRRSQPPPC